jgi:hypothetical protein
MLVPPGRADAWVEAIEALTDNVAALRLGEGAFARWARMHSPDKSLLELERAYRVALDT